jgi:hypothetical protein
VRRPPRPPRPRISPFLHPRLRRVLRPRLRLRITLGSKLPRPAARRVRGEEQRPALPSLSDPRMMRSSRHFTPLPRFCMPASTPAGHACRVLSQALCKNLTLSAVPLRPRGSQSSPRDHGLPPSGQDRTSIRRETNNGSSPRGGASVLQSRRNGGLINSSSPADVEKLVELVYRQQDARLRRIALGRLVRTVTLTMNAWRCSFLSLNVKCFNGTG